MSFVFSTIISQNQFGSRTTAEDVINRIPEEVNESLRNKSVIITGANSGIGFETARVLYGCGLSHLILAGRNKSSLEQSVEQIKQSEFRAQLTGINEDVKKTAVSYVVVDLSDQDSIRRASEELHQLNVPIHVIINNAGLMNTPHQYTPQGLELQIGSNNHGHFLFTNLLLDIVARSVKQARDRGEANYQGRVINVSSAAHIQGTINFEDLHFRTRPYNGWTSYGQSKLANILHAKALNHHFKENNFPITAVSLHPGAIRTNLGRTTAGLGFIHSLTSCFWKTIPQGAATSVWAAVSRESASDGGHYAYDCNRALPTAEGQREDIALRLFEVTERETNSKFPLESLQSIFR